MTDPAGANAPPPRRSLRETLAVYSRPESLRMFALGFSSGLPFLLVQGTLGLRLRQAGVEIDAVGYASWIGLMYGFKWAWAPLVDRVPLPLLTRAMGRRRSWLLLAQATVAVGLLGMAWSDPAGGLGALVGWALLAAFGSATQDIALDALRIESAPAREQPALAACYQTGYKLATIWAGAGALWLTAQAGSPELGARAYQDAAWRVTYAVMAASMAVGALTVLFSREPVRVALPAARGARQWLEQTLVEPFADFFRRWRWKAALVLALIALYRFSDGVITGNIANSFYWDMGFTLQQIADVSKIFGVVMTLAGTFIGGALAMRLGVMRVLVAGAFLSAASNLLFAWLAVSGNHLPLFVLVICGDNLSSGIASAAFIGYLSGLTSVRYSATQYALFSSIMQLLPKFAGGYAGAYIKAFGYPNFFIATALLGIPALALAWAAARPSRPAEAGQGR